MTIYTTVFILGFGYRKETDSQNKNNDTINTDTDKEKTEIYLMPAFDYLFLDIYQVLF